MQLKIKKAFINIDKFSTMVGLGNFCFFYFTFSKDLLAPLFQCFFAITSFGILQMNFRLECIGFSLDSLSRMSLVLQIVGFSWNQK